MHAWGYKQGINNKPTLPNRQSGFLTLKEILVVAVIVGLLGSVALASVKDVRQRAREARLLSELRSVETALNLWKNAHDGWLPSRGGSGSTGYWQVYCFENHREQYVECKNGLKTAELNVVNLAEWTDFGDYLGEVWPDHEDQTGLRNSFKYDFKDGVVPGNGACKAGESWSDETTRPAVRIYMQNIGKEFVEMLEKEFDGNEITLNADGTMDVPAGMTAEEVWCGLIRPQWWNKGPDYGGDGWSAFYNIDYTPTRAPGYCGNAECYCGLYLGNGEFGICPSEK